jgi:N6-adenosine-specific RNA methylase IME4
VKSLRVMEVWGFEYKSHLVWDKVIQGTGYWLRNRHELLLIGTRGNPVAPAMGSQGESIYVEKRRHHSAKPLVVYQWIEAMFPTLPKLEMFARVARPGWEVWGAEAPQAAEVAA